jgi:hypothetical protein
MQPRPIRFSSTYTPIEYTEEELQQIAAYNKGLKYFELLSNAAETRGDYPKAKEIADNVFKFQEVFRSMFPNNRLNPEIVDTFENSNLSNMALAIENFKKSFDAYFNPGLPLQPKELLRIQYVIEKLFKATFIVAHEQIENLNAPEQKITIIMTHSHDLLQT